ncbi:MAG TPA: cell wall hydrolase, partial [Candidatus Galloscillospira stercoripullorum]|nr:cell wall hydrolase [Candidatus Galloscillospira stercoripullorum]
QKNQFPGATNATPTSECIIAAKLALEGVNVVPNAYWFNRAGLNSWASKNKTLLTIIEDHAFYG